jgi:hypothetical protein
MWMSILRVDDRPATITKAAAEPEIWMPAMVA